MTIISQVLIVISFLINDTPKKYFQQYYTECGANWSFHYYSLFKPNVLRIWKWIASAVFYSSQPGLKFMIG